MERLNQISISQIVVPPDRRRLSGTADIAASMAEVGLINPISVTSEWVLIAGLRRLEAAKSLGWDTIAAVVKPIEGLQAELAEIDENIVRNEPNALERADLLKRRKEVYEAMHPTAKAGTAGAIASNKVQGNATDKLSVASFTAETAKQTGINERTVRRDVKLATDLDDEAKETVKASPIADNKSQLQKLAKQKPETQRKVAKAIAEGKAKTVEQAVAAEPAETMPDPKNADQQPPWADFNAQVDAIACDLESLALRMGRVLEVKKDNSKGKWSYFLSYQATVLAARSLANLLRENVPGGPSDRPPGYCPARDIKIRMAVRGGK